MIDRNNKLKRDQRRKRDFPSEIRKVFLENLEFELIHKEPGLELKVEHPVLPKIIR